MAATVIGGPLTWAGEQDAEGHRTYHVLFRVQTASTLEGPATVMTASGLPAVGDTWLVDSDADLWAWCLPERSVKAEQKSTGERTQFWQVDLTFSTKPPDRQRCQTNPIEDPLLEPQKVSGSFIKKTEEATKDRLGQPIVTSSFEQISGPQNEWDADGGDTISIEQNVADLELGVLSALKNCVNDSPLWGMPARKVKFSSYSWEKKFYGICSAYYTRRLEFEVNAAGFDRDLLDEGTKVLHGHWHPTTGVWVTDKVNVDGTDIPADPTNPSHFDRYQDRNANNARVILNGFGVPYVPNPLGFSTTCTQCPDGSPFKFNVVGLITGTVELSKVTDAPSGDCKWSFAGSPQDVDLVYVPGSSRWELTISSLSGVKWTHPAAGWACKGPNTLTCTVGSPGLNPTTLTIVDPFSPGKIHVEKYAQGNLLALNIPTTL